MAKNRMPGRDFFCEDKCEYVCFLHLLYPFALLFWCIYYTCSVGCSVGLLSVLITLMFLFAQRARVTPFLRSYTFMII